MPTTTTQNRTRHIAACMESIKDKLEQKAKLFGPLDASTRRFPREVMIESRYLYENYNAAQEVQRQLASQLTARNCSVTVNIQRASATDHMLILFTVIDPQTITSP